MALKTALKTALRYFPLVGRRRHPECPPLPERVQEIADLALAAERQDAEALHNAAHALNKAALLASDNGLLQGHHDRGEGTVDITRRLRRKSAM